MFDRRYADRIASAATTVSVPTLGAAGHAGHHVYTSLTRRENDECSGTSSVGREQHIGDRTEGEHSLEARESQTGAATLPDVKDSKGSALFANPQKGALYLQVGAVERGMATIIAEGLRQHGLVSFVAPGPTDRIFRVLVGPLANQDEYKRVKGQVDSIDVGNFARQFEK